MSKSRFGLRFMVFNATFNNISTDNTMAKRKCTKGQTTIYITYTFYVIS